MNKRLKILITIAIVIAIVAAFWQLIEYTESQNYHNDLSEHKEISESDIDNSLKGDNIADELSEYDILIDNTWYRAVDNLYKIEDKEKVIVKQSAQKYGCTYVLIQEGLFLRKIHETDK